MKWVKVFFEKGNFITTLQEVISGIKNTLIEHDKQMIQFAQTDKLTLEKLHYLDSENKDLKARLRELENRFLSLKIVLDTDDFKAKSNFEKYINEKEMKSDSSQSLERKDK